MEKHLNILILEDADEDVDLIERELVKVGMRFTTLVVKTKDGFEEGLKSFNPDLVLSDHMLPNFSGIDAFNLFQAYEKESERHVPFILITGAVSKECAMQCLKMGMDDYILKDRLKQLPASIEKALEKCRLESEIKNNPS